MGSVTRDFLREVAAGLGLGLVILATLHRLGVLNLWIVISAFR